MPRVISIQIGKAKEYMHKLNDDETKSWRSAFDKQPLQGDVVVHSLGVAGDEQADTKNHGGADKAVLLYSFEHYPSWLASYPNQPFQAGAFGENFTVTALDETNVCIGDVYSIGEVMLEVSQPRVPCWKISERWQEPTLTDAVRKTGRTGWYARVQQGGAIEAGADVVLEDRQYPTLTVARLNRLLTGQEAWAEDVIDALRACAALSAEWKKYIPN